MNGNANGYKNGYIAIPLEKLEKVYEKPPNEPFKTFLAGVLVLIAWLSNDVVLAIVHDKVPYSSPPLPDIWFSWFPEMTELIKIAELILCYCLVLAIGISVLHTFRFVVARRMLVIVAFAYAGRAFCIILTQVPVPSPKTYCSPRSNETTVSLILARSFGAFARLGMDMNSRELCGDLIYSGHTILLTICHLMVSRYTPRRINWLSWTTGLGATVAIVCILMARKHYTVDIAFGYYVATRLFYNYHTMLELKLKNVDLELTFLDRVIWHRIFKYFEANVKSPIPNTLDFGRLLPR